MRSDDEPDHDLTRWQRPAPSPSHSLDHAPRHERSSTQSLPVGPNIAPGRLTLTSSLPPAVAGPIARKADGNGVAAHADQAVADASGSGGQTLPATLQRRFESSLGADLSGVRVHTGPSSAAAARALSARAYTLGSDIHFNAGQYDPQSDAGQHLLAHEVAHTVQQAGIMRRVQTKLDVSSPGDAHEVEADRAADAMVRGQPASVVSAFGISRKVMREKNESEQNAPPANWTPPFDLGTVNDRPGACVALIDISTKLTEFRDAGFQEMASVIKSCQDKAISLSGSDSLTPDEARDLSALGVAVQLSHQKALNDMKRAIGEQLAKFTNVDFGEAEASISEAIHAQFMDGANPSKLGPLKEMLSKVKDFTGKVQKYAGWASKAKSVVAAAAKFEDLKKAVEGLNSKFKTASELVAVAEAIGTLAGKIGEKPGGTQNDIAKIKAGFVLVDFALSKTSVPIIGDLWDKMIKPTAEAALTKIQQLDNIAEKSAKMVAMDTWFQEAMRGGGPPQLFSYPGEKALLGKYFPGGQAMLDFMWQLMRSGVREVPPGIEDYFLKFKSQFNAGSDEKIDEQSHWKVFSPSTWGARNTSPNLVAWLNAHKTEAWAMIYGSLPHP